MRSGSPSPVAGDLFFSPGRPVPEESIWNFSKIMAVVPWPFHSYVIIPPTMVGQEVIPILVLSAHVKDLFCSEKGDFSSILAHSFNNQTWTKPANPYSFILHLPRYESHPNPSPSMHIVPPKVPICVIFLWFVWNPASAYVRNDHDLPPWSTANDSHHHGWSKWSFLQESWGEWHVQAVIYYRSVPPSSFLTCLKPTSENHGFKSVSLLISIHDALSSDVPEAVVLNLRIESRIWSCTSHNVPCTSACFSLSENHSFKHVSLSIPIHNALSSDVPEAVVFNLRIESGIWSCMSWVCLRSTEDWSKTPEPQCLCVLNLIPSLSASNVLSNVPKMLVPQSIEHAQGTWSCTQLEWASGTFFLRNATCAWL